MVKICMTSQGVFCYTCWILGVCTCFYFCNLVHILCPQSHHQSLLPTSRFNLKLALSEEPPRVSSLAIHYAHRGITKVHQKTFMKRTLTHCERTTPHTPISTSALLWVLCGILTWFKFIMKSLFFPPFAHLNHNVAIFQFAKHTYLNKGKTIEPSDMLLDRWTLYTTYNLLVHWEHQLVCASSQRHPLSTVWNDGVGDAFVPNHNNPVKYLFSRRQNNVQNWGRENY